MEDTKKRRFKIHETTIENDIRYRGPLSPTHFKILGWLCIVIAQVAVIVRLMGYLDAEVAAKSVDALKALGYVSALALPFLLIVNFAQLLGHLPIPKLDLKGLKDTIAIYVSLLL